jgi:beta-galactosidase/beta-glucuronidase
LANYRYGRVPTLNAWARDPNDTRPVILCEYSHAMNNSNGAITFPPLSPE